MTRDPLQRKFVDTLATMPVVKVIPVALAYEIDESGNVRRIGSKRFLQPCVLKRGRYLAVALWQNNKGRTWPVHQLVALAFHGPRPSVRHHAAHDDGDKMNNHWTNVLWKTKEENEADKIKHGRTNRGERNGSAKLTDAQASEIKARLAAGESPVSVAKDYPVSISTIQQIKRGTRHAN